MRSVVLVLSAILLATVSPTAVAQVPSAEQLELLRSMSPEDREALMEQLGLGGASLDDVGITSENTSRDPRATRDDPRGSRFGRQGLNRTEFEPVDLTFKPEDSLLVEIDFKKDRPPRIESQGEGLPPISIPGEVAPVLEPAERAELQ